MSRFLDYGVFVPDPSSKQGLTQSSQAATGQWAQVEGKWCKVGPDGKPLNAPSKSSFSQSSPINMGGGGEGGVDIDGGGSSAAEPFSQTAGAMGEGTDWGHRKQEEGDDDDASADLHGDDDDAGLGEDGDDGEASGSTTTILPKPSPSATAAGAAAPRATASSSRSRSVFNSQGGEDDHEDNEGAAAGGGGGGIGGSGNSGGLTVAVDEAASRTGSAGGIDSKSKTLPIAVEGGSASRPRAMLTPGLSRSYSTDEVVGKFFGEDASAAASDMTATPGGGSGSGEGVGAGAACVGERAPSGDKGEAKGGKKAKHARSGSGSSNTANSPVAARAGKEGESEPVETRDVACQWDGSEL
ncbi:unnamed protein product, partial [Ectocarpus sp. 12 AP-2014]